MKMRRKTANAAAFGPADRNAVTGAGAPWYTSGAQIWNGAADTLKASPTNINAAASADEHQARARSRASSTRARISARLMVPVVP